MGKRVIDDNTLKAIADDIRLRTGTDDLIKPTQIPECIGIIEDKAYQQGCDDGEFHISEIVVAPAQDKLSQRIADTTGQGTLNEWVDKAIEDFDSIEAAIEAQGVDVPYNNTSVMGELVNEACVTANGIGYETGKNEGVAEGKQAQYDEFWDVYQAKGKRSDYGRAFAGAGWNSTVFTPKYDMNVGYGYQMFLGNKNITDLKAILEKCNVTLNLTNGYELYGLFQACTALTHLPALTIPDSSGLSTTFYQCYALKTIDCLYLPNGGTFDRTFYQCNVLEDIVIEGVIATNLDMRWSPLTKASIASIIEHLSATTTGKTLTLKNTAVDNAFEASEGLADGSTSDEWTSLLGTKTNWTISLV